MKPWADALNLLATRFWYGCGELEELAAWADAANAEEWEVHPDVWSLYGETSIPYAKALIVRLAAELNGFTPVSPEGERYAARVLGEQLDAFVREQISPFALCTLVQRMDTDFISVRDEQARRAKSRTLDYPSWLGNLWSCCDWCEEHETHADRPALLEEARRVMQALAASPPASSG
jgi:hypothetical protein